MNVNLQTLLDECHARRLSVDDVMGALAASMVRPPAPVPAPVDQAAPAPPSAARAAPPVAPPPPVAAAPAPGALAVRVPNALAHGSPTVDATGANWRDAAGTWFDAAAHAWNRAGHPAVTPAGKFRAKRAGSAAPVPPTAPAGAEITTTGAEITTTGADPDEALEQLPPADAKDLAEQLAECAAVHGLNELELFGTHFEALFGDWQSGTAAEQAAYREVEIAMDAKREELTERLPVSDSAGHGHAGM